MEETMDIILKRGFLSYS